MSKDPIIRGPKVYAAADETSPAWIRTEALAYSIVAKGGLHFIKGNHDAYFSLTGDVYRGFVDRDQQFVKTAEDMGGCIHDELLKHWPELAPLVALHLSDSKGVPMHCLDNGFYYVAHLIPGCGDRSAFNLSFAKRHYGQADYTAEECIAIMAKHFRLDMGHANLLIEAMKTVALGVPQYQRVYEGKAKPVVKDFLATWIETQKPRWEAEANAAIEQFGLVRYS